MVVGLPKSVSSVKKTQGTMRRHPTEDFMPILRLLRSTVLLMIAATSVYAAATPTFADSTPVITPPLKPDPAIDMQVDFVLSQLTLEEKIGLCSGTPGNFRGVSRLNIPDLILTDGPRGPNNSGPCTAFPSGVLFGATWDPALIERAGKVMGEETRSGGRGILLGPSINIQRDPLGGRFFEYYTEDPYLNAKLAAAVVTGIQSQGVAACLKHYICNNREDNRNNYMSMVDQRTLNEIYLPGFKAAVEDGHAWAVMTSANGVNGDFVSDSKALLQDTLMDKWGFQGMALTDWLQARSTVKSALAGLDVSMPGGDCPFAQPLTDAVKAGQIPMSVIDDKARRVLRVYAFAGLLDKRDYLSMLSKAHWIWSSDVPNPSVTAPVGSCYFRIAANVGNGKVIKDAVFVGSGDNEFTLYVNGKTAGEGSDWSQVQIIDLTKYTHPAANVIAVKATNTGDGPNAAGFIGVLRVEYTDGSADIIPTGAGWVSREDAKPGWNTATATDAAWQPATDSGPEGMAPWGQLHSYWSGATKNTPAHQLVARQVADEGIVLLKNDNHVLPLDPAKISNILVIGPSADRKFCTPGAGGSSWVAGPYEITTLAGIRAVLGEKTTYLSTDSQGAAGPDWSVIDPAVQKADAVVVVGGIDLSLDTEGTDRKDLHFPTDQQSLIEHVSKLNQKTIVVLINGSPLEIGDWLGDVPALVEAWYPGMEGGNAIADVLFGKVDPSGRLSFSWPKVLADSPSHKLGTETNDEVDYKEGLLVGYRYYDTDNVAPLFPFGFGLSYTTFSFSSLHIASQGDSVTASLTVKNTGVRDGIEIVQVYVHPESPSVTRPIHELKAFTRVQLKAGKSQLINFKLGPDAFAYYDVVAGKWRVDPGKYEIQAGTSSRDIKAVRPATVSSHSFTQNSWL
jgi:beta-glucosidase